MLAARIHDFLMATRAIAGKARRSRQGKKPLQRVDLRLVSAGTPLQSRGEAGFRMSIIASTLLLLVTLAVYYRATTNPFVNYDDTGYVTENPHVQQGLTLDTLRWSLASTYASNWHPLTWLSHALDCQLFGLNPAGHHFTSVLLHAFNSTLLYLLLLAATRARWRSLLVAFLFALHPINVESVAWIAERKNVLSIFFFLLTVAAYGWYARKPRFGRYCLLGAMFLLGLAAKPMVVTLPFVLLLLDFWPLQRVRGLPLPSTHSPVPQIPFLWLALEKAPLLLLSLVSSVVTVIAQSNAIATNQGLPFALRCKNALYAYTMYVAKAFWPARLASFYPHQGARLAAWQLALCAGFLLAVTALVWRQRSKLYLPVGWLIFLGTLVPVIGLVQVGDQGMADRYAYLPLIGIFIMVVWGLAEIPRLRTLKLRVWMPAALALLSILAFLTWRQIGFWHSSYDLWSHALQVTEQNYMAEDYVGTSLLLNAFEESGQRYSEEATVHFQNAARINPYDAISHLNLGAAFHEKGNLREAARQYAMVLQLTTDQQLLAKALVDLGAASRQMGDYAAAGQYYREVLKIDPRNQAVFRELGKLGMEQRTQELAAQASRNPSVQAYLQLAQMQEITGRLVEARQSYQRVLQFDPNSVEARAGLKRTDDLSRTAAK
jgi:Tfp pilus assembly protein PilF